MALGFGFNKTKVMQAAERNVLQGKITNAIAEYEKVIAHDARDLTVQNTLGDLYARTGRTEDALQCFRKVADAYAADGFAMKAIAMYKKINKLNPNAVECILKLGELYSLQGLFSDARAQYMAAAEHQLSRGDSEAAAAVYRKALELDPENAHMQQRLAELYLSSGRQEQAAEVYIMAAQSLHCRGRHSAALDMLEKLLKVSPKHPAALMLCGKVAAESGNHARAIGALEKIPDLEKRPEALRQLVRARLASSETEVAEEQAGKLLRIHNDVSGMFAIAEHLIQNAEIERGLRLLHQFTDEAMTANSADVMRIMQAALAQEKNTVAVLEAAIQINRRVAEKGSVAELVELLANAYIKNGELDRAHALYTELAELEPGNEEHQRNLAQLVAKIGEGSESGDRGEGGDQAHTSALVAETTTVDALAGVPDPDSSSSSYTAETTQAIEAALTDAELYQSYNSPAKAIAALEAVLPQAPRDGALNQRLAMLYVRAERYGDAAKCFSVLKKVHEAENRTEEAEQCATMEEKYRQRAANPEAKFATAERPAVKVPPAQPAPAGAVPEFELAPSQAPELETFDQQPEPAAAEPQRPTAEQKPAVVAPAPTPKSSASEWDEMAVEDDEPEAELAGSFDDGSQAQNPFAAALEEAGFYLQHGLRTEADAALRQAESLRPGAAEVAQIRADFMLAAEQDAPLPEIEINQPELEIQHAAAEEKSHGPQKVSASEVPHAASGNGAASTTKPGSLSSIPLTDDEAFDLAWELDSALPDDFGLDQGQPAANGKAAEPRSTPAKAAKRVEEPRVAMKSAKPAAKAVQAAAQADIAKDPFGDIFEEFRSSMEQPDNDLDQHYNMGIALKDMGLLEEAVGELQRVCNALERGAEFPDAVQAYTWLAHCLVERGAPQAAVRWYKRALSIPALDPDAQVAIHYELGLAYEKAGVRDDALEHFMEAYGSNIDYRDVAERIEALRG
jgi:pilus assembly protein FimV